MGRVFISYRREDTVGPAGRIYDRLAAHFGRDVVFRDVDAIPLGVDFRQHLSYAVGKCDVLLAIIGEDWLGATRAGKRRLEDPTDFVRIELESALKRGIPVVPVLIEPARMPLEDELPANLRELAYRNAATVDPGLDFHSHMDRLILGLDWLLRADHGVEQSTHGRSLGNPPEGAAGVLELDADHSLELFHGSLANVRADALVSSDDNFLSALSGVSRALAQVAGPEVHRERQQIVGQRRPKLADVVRTSAGGLPCRYLYHAITVEYGPAWDAPYAISRYVNRSGHGHSSGEVPALPDPPVFIDDLGLRRLIVNVLLKATADGVRSIGMPVFGTGAAGRNLAGAAEVILDELSLGLVKTPIPRVTLALVGNESERHLLERLFRSRGGR